MMLKEKEELVMNTIWDADKPITSMDIKEILSNENGENRSDVNVHRILKILLDNELISVSGFIAVGTQYARQFIPTLSKEEYTVRMLSDKKMSSGSLARIALGLVKESGTGKKDEVSDELIEELEKALSDLKEAKEG